MKRLLAVGALIAALGGFTQDATASFHGQLISLNVSNVLGFNYTNTAYPSFPQTNVYATNASATNVIYTVVGPTNYTNVATGNGVDISAYDHFGIDVQGQVVSTNTNSVPITATFIVSCANQTPQIIYGTNIWTASATNVLQNDWVNPLQMPITFTITIPSNSASSLGTNWLHWYTNLPASSLAADATYIGLYSIGAASNANNNGGFITNLSISIEQKQIPKPFAY